MGTQLYHLTGHVQRLVMPSTWLQRINCEGNIQGDKRMTQESFAREDLTASNALQERAKRR